MRSSLVVTAISGPFPCNRLNLKFIERRIPFFLPHLKYSFRCALHSTFRGGRTTRPLPYPSAPQPIETFLSENEGREARFGILATLIVWPCAWFHSKDFSNQMRLQHSVILSSIFPWQHQNFYLIPGFDSNWNRKWKVADMTRSLTFGRTWRQTWLSSLLTCWPGVSEPIRTLSQVYAVSQGLLWGKLLTNVSMCASILLYFSFMTLFPHGVRVSQLRGGLLLGTFAKFAKSDC